MRLLTPRCLSARRTLPPFGFHLPLLIGCVLPRGDLVEGAPLRFHPHVGVARKHGARNMPRGAHDHLVTGSETDRGLHRERVALHGTSSSLGASRMESTALSLVGTFCGDAYLLAQPPPARRTVLLDSCCSPVPAAEPLPLLVFNWQGGGFEVRPFPKRSVID